MEALTLLLSPIVPHIAEELWAGLGHSQSVLLAPWPVWREDAIERDEALIVIQVNGKLRSRMTMAVDAEEDELKAKALADENVQKFLQSKPVRKIIVVRNKLVNIVL
jgi:leucyl-tRNA synthetase